MKRRGFLGGVAAWPLAWAAPVWDQACSASLDGAWQFRLDAAGEWKQVRVPHTWQVAGESAGYRGVAWYRRDFELPASWRGRTVRVEFEAVYHSARVSVNGEAVGEHLGRGYTAFQFDLTRAARFGEVNTIEVRVDNAFSDRILPRGDSFDWAMDGGITRPVRLLATPPVFLEAVDVDAAPQLSTGQATLRVRIHARNSSSRAVEAAVGYDVIDETTGRVVLSAPRAARAALAPGAAAEIALPESFLANPRLWHFDRPHLYRLVATLEDHSLATIFGIRKFEVKDGGFHLNGERVRLMGVERMAGSHPDYGMAEPAAWIEHDHRDLKELNCVFTRVHWPQDRRVLDFCDRHGILIQLEPPAWGPKTFRGAQDTPPADILRNGLDQLREMIGRDRNHPSVVAWGLCNEVNGQNPPAQAFVRRMAEEARRLDPSRPLTYASHSLRQNIERDVAGELDFISWNQYYGSWQKGGVEDVRANLAAIERAFPGKPIVVSEYGYCECAPDRTGGDRRRIEILRDHSRVLRESPRVAGLIFFCYNDYRTHIGDQGQGALQQRVHGVVDLYGERKPSFEALRQESSPVEELRLTPRTGGLTAVVRTRKSVPAYTLEGYRLRWIVCGFGDLPMERHETPLPRLEAGAEVTLPLTFKEVSPARVRVDVVRPTGFSARTEVWRPAVRSSSM